MITYCGTLANWVQAIATVGLFVVAFVAVCYAKNQLAALRDSSDQQRLSALMNEITSDEASFDRGFVRNRVPVDADETDIQKYVEKGRKLVRKKRYADIWKTGIEIGQEELRFALIGVAIEKTIVRYDRVALFVLKDNNKFRLEPPEWVLADVNMIWPRLYKWIEYRRATEEDEYKNKQYANDLQRLYKHPRTKELRQTDHD